MRWRWFLGAPFAPLHVGWTAPIARVEPIGGPLAGPIGPDEYALPLGNALALRVGPITAINTLTGVTEAVPGLDVSAHLAAAPESDTPLGGLVASCVELPGGTATWLVSWTGDALDAVLDDASGAWLGTLVYAVVRLPGKRRDVLPFRVTASQRAPA